jgi:tagF domain-containing protein
MENKLVSLIVVVYKIEKFLPKCLDSLQNQTYQNIEIVLSVSDGGDRSLEICEKYANQDYRFKVIKTKPQGIAMARNVGMRAATGEYLAWVDGDDWVESTFVENLVRHMEKKDASVSLCGYYKEYTDKSIQVVSSNLTSGEPVSVKEIYKEIISYNSFGMEIWDKLFKTADVREIEFPNVREAEDRFWLVEVLKKTKHCSYTGTAEYHYRIRNDSCSRTDINAEISLESDEKLVNYVLKTYPELDRKLSLYLFLAIYRVIYDSLMRDSHFSYNHNRELFHKLRFNAIKAKKVCIRKNDKVKLFLARTNFTLLLKFMRLTQIRRTTNDYY